MSPASSTGRCRGGGSARAGFTLVELLVVVGIVATLAGMLMPAIQIAREVSRRAQCQSNMKQVGQALQSHDTKKLRLPGWRDKVDPYTTQTGSCVSWTVPILPDVARMDLYTAFVSPTDQDDVTTKTIPVYVCPTASPDMAVAAPLSYAVNAGMGAEVVSASGDQFRGDGVFIDAVGNANIARLRYSPIRSSLAQVTAGDGSASTLLLSERSGQNFSGVVSWRDEPKAMLLSAPTNGLPWNHVFLHPPVLSGSARPEPSTVYRVVNVTAEMAPLGDLTDFQLRYPSSPHQGRGVNAVFCDGHARFISQRIDSWVYCQMLTSDSRLLETDPTKPGSRAYRWQMSPASGLSQPYVFNERDLEK